MRETKNPNIHQELSIKRHFKDFTVTHVTKQGENGEVVVFYKQHDAPKIFTAIVDREGGVEVTPIRFYKAEGGEV
jgi:hypothetical protein